MTNPVKSYAAHDLLTDPSPHLKIKRRSPGPKDVAIEILFCGICHSDLHYTHNDGPTSCRRCTRRARPRYRGACEDGRRRCYEAQDRRPGGGGLPGRFGSHLPQLPKRAGELLPEPDFHLRFSR